MVELRAHLADGRDDGEALDPIGPARSEDQTHLATVRGTNDVAALDSQVVEKSLQVLRVILHGPGLERLVAQELAPEVV